MEMGNYLKILIQYKMKRIFILLTLFLSTYILYAQSTKYPMPAFFHNFNGDRINFNGDGSTVEIYGNLDLDLQTTGGLNLRAFYGATTGQNPYFSIYGFETGAAVKYGRFMVDTNGDFQIEAEKSLLLFDIGDTIFHATGATNIFLGKHSGIKTTGSENTFIGTYAGYKNIIGNANVFLGKGAGYKSNSDNNTFLGYTAGYNNTTGTLNQYIGNGAGFNNITGNSNIFIGYKTGFDITAGGSNVIIGNQASENSTVNDFNTIVGVSAGFTGINDKNVLIGYRTGNNCDSGNVFIGYEAGYNEAGANKLYIYNSNDTNNVLIVGNFSTGKVPFYRWFGS